MKLRKQRIIYNTCPLCDSKRIFEFKVGDCSNHPLYHPAIDSKIQWMICEACFHVFTDGYFTPEAEAILFSKTNPSQIVGADMERQRFISARIVEKVRSFRQTGKWLDVGVGNGSLLFTAEEYGYQVVGVDLRKTNVKILNDMGYEAHCCKFEELSEPNAYNIISMADVLEHMPDPRAALLAVAEMLSPTGALFISMPNMDSGVWKYLDAVGSNPYWGELEHYHNFGFARLCALFEKTGFSVFQYGISERYRACMEVIAIRKGN